MDRFSSLERRESLRSIDGAVQPKPQPISRLEEIKPSRGIHVRQEHVLQPVRQQHMLNCEGRQEEPPGMRKSLDMPAVPDVKKAVEDYNSIDYQIIAMNLWKSTARELI
jgi:hypothetical protein